MYGPACCRHTASNAVGSGDIREIQPLFRFRKNKGDFRMTRISMTMMLAGTALAMLAAAPARSVEAVNGVMPNGLSPNGVMPNGISPNGSTGGERATNSAGEIGRVIAIELPRRSGAGISVGRALP